MRKLAHGAVLVAALFLAACSCGLEKKSLDQLETNLKRQQVDHKLLMNKVGRVPEEQTDWDKHYKATFDLIDGLKKSAD